LRTNDEAKQGRGRPRRQRSLPRLSSFRPRTPRNYNVDVASVLHLLAVAALLVLAPSNGSAVPLTYQVGTRSTVTVNSAEPGLILASNLPVTTPFSFTRNDNGVQDFDETGIDQFSFDFFRAWVTEEVIDPDDFQHRNIVATLDLTTLGPSIITGSAASGTARFSAPSRLDSRGFAGRAISYGTIRPDLCRQRPTFTIDFSDAIFDQIGSTPRRSTN
jgi:hypothetical protein